MFVYDCTLSEFITEILIELIKFWLLMCGILNFKLTDKKKYYIADIFILTVSLILLSVFKFKNAFTLGILSTVLSGFAVSGKKKILWTVFSFFTICTFDELCAYFFRLIVSEAEVFADSALNSLSIMLFSLIFFVKRFVTRKKNIRFDNLLDRPELIVFVILQAFISLMVSQYYSTKKIAANNTFFTVIVIAFVSAEIVVAYNWYSKKQYMRTSELNRKLLESKESYYKKLLEQENETRRFRHDIRNHILCLETLLNSEKYDEVKKYLKNMDDSISSFRSSSKTGNMFLNSILSDLESRYPEVTSEWKGHVSDELNIEDIDVCTIFSNLLGNAFENAVLSENEKTVTVTAKILGSTLAVTIRNSIGVSVKEKNGILETHKKDSVNHGLGLQNVKKCISNLNGDLKYSYDDKEFKVEIIIPEAVPAC